MNQILITQNNSNMKKTLLIFTAILMMAGLSNRVMAQTNSASDDADAFATIVAPIAITKTIDLQFGSVIAGVGTVTVDVASVRTYSVPAMNPGDQGETPTAAAFTVTGEGGYGFDITLPDNDDVVLVKGAEDMTVTDFTSSEGSSTALVGGTKDFTVGAKLTVETGLSSGEYTGSFEVTVAYN
jgi:hypothetical protein